MLCVCIYIECGIQGTQKKASGPWELELKVFVSYQTWLLKPNSGPLEEQYTGLTTEPSQQPELSVLKSPQAVPFCEVTTLLNFVST